MADLVVLQALQEQAHLPHRLLVHGIAHPQLDAARVERPHVRHTILWAKGGGWLHSGNTMGAGWSDTRTVPPSSLLFIHTGVVSEPWIHTILRWRKTPERLSENHTELDFIAKK